MNDAEARLRKKCLRFRACKHFSLSVCIDDISTVLDELARVREQLADTQKRFAEYMGKSFPVEINVDGKMYSPKLLAESSKLRAELEAARQRLAWAEELIELHGLTDNYEERFGGRDD